MKLEGRVLWLTNSIKDLQAQLKGGNLEVDPADRPSLRYGLNTDLMINGAACTKGYTPEILGPHFLEGLDGHVGYDAIRKGGFEVVVAGPAYGSGSSREVAVVAHEGAGIRLVVAESLQRIFQENLVYSGMPATTDLSVVFRLLAGENIELNELTQELPPLFKAVADAGGLLPFAQQLLQSSEARVPPSLMRAGFKQKRPMTCAEKILSRKVYTSASESLGVESLRPGDQVLCRVGFRGMHEYTAGMVMTLYEEAFGQAPLYDAERVACFEDHFVLLEEKSVPKSVKSQRLNSAKQLTQEMVKVVERYGLQLHGPHRTHPAGVCHRVVLETYAEPGSIVVLTDSHTPTAGVLNTFAFGIGSTAMAFALRTGLVPVTVPKSVRIEVSGSSYGVLSPKDLILHIIGDPYFKDEQWKTSPSDTCVLEFAGPALDQWSVDELSVLTNMTVEGGLMTGILPPSEPAREFLRKRSPRCSYEESFVEPDDGAEYIRTIHINLNDVPLTVATPGDARHRAPLNDHIGTPIQNIVIASCTGGSLADLRAAAEVLKGRKIASGVRMTVTPSSAAVASLAAEEGLLTRFRELGAEVTAPGCGSCIGNGPGVPAPGETTASTTNRNFDRRMGASGPVYLVSPAVAAATAVTGYLEDPRHLQSSCIM